MSEWSQQDRRAIVVAHTRLLELRSAMEMVKITTPMSVEPHSAADSCRQILDTMDHLLRQIAVFLGDPLVATPTKEGGGA